MAYTGHIMTLANSIIGVGILAMPFCFQKCGIILSIVLIILSQYITRISCHYLLKSSLLTRRKSFEFLALYAFGPSGKLMVELCIIGYLIGTCITYFVVVGDLTPQIVSKTLNLVETDSLRTWVMVTVTFLFIVPLALLKNVDSLATVCIASIGFYFCLVIKIMFEARTHLFNADWLEHVTLWKPAGILQCLPIFSMALACQMQLFEVIESINAASLEKLNEIVRMATTICTSVYIFVGFFGYIAFCTQPFAGNILINFSTSFLSDAIKLGFVLSVAFSFPLVIFPCRASIYSLLYRRGHADSTGYIPETRFKCITITIVVFALVIGIIIPSIELVIGLVGSTIGVAICIMFPASCFMKVFKKDSTEKLLAQSILISGFCLMILGTYANLNAIDEKRSGLPIIEVPKEPELHNHENIKPNDIINDDIKLIVPEVVLPPKIERKPEKFIDPMPKENVEPKLEPSPVPKKETAKESRIETKLERKPEDNVKQIDLVNKPTPVVEVVSPTPKQQPKKSNDEISKDAIKKEEDVIANEQSKKEKIAEIKETKEELKQLQFLEKKVVELREELAKQNLETQHLVQEKLGVIADKVDEIERKVQKEADEKNVNEVQARSANDDSLKRNSDTKSLKRAEAIVENISLVAKENAQKGPILKFLADNLQKSTAAKAIDAAETNNTVYEPMSYKVGEAMNQENLLDSDDSKKKKAAGPLPLPLFLNATLRKAQDRTKQTTRDGDNSKELVAKRQDETNAIRKEAEKVAKQKESVVEKEPDRENIESIRRDILEVARNRDDDSTAQEETKFREKRQIDKTKTFCINWDTEKQYCRDAKVKDELLSQNNLAADLKIQPFGRDLKSVHEGS